MHDVKIIVAEEVKMITETIQHEAKSEADGKSRGDANAVIQEIHGIQSRENNVIIHRLNEGTAITKAGNIEHDTEALKGLFQLLGTNIKIDEDIEEQGQIRLGIKLEENIRPLLLKFKQKEKKSAFMRNLNKLKANKDHTLYGKISVAHDMSKEEREQERNLVAEMKEKNAKNTNPNKIYRIRGYAWDRKLVQINIRQ